MKDKNFELFQKAVEEGDEWLLQQGIISDVSKNTIISNVYVKYPRVKYMEFDLDQEQRIIDMTVYLGFWSLLFMTIFGRVNKLIDNLFADLDMYLRGNYQIRVKARLYTKKALQESTFLEDE